MATVCNIVLDRNFCDAIDIQRINCIPIRPHNHKGAEAGGLKGQGAVGISKDIQNLHIAIRGLVEHFQRVGSCTFHCRQFVQTGDGAGGLFTLGRLHRVALGIFGGDLQAQNGSHTTKIIRVALIEALHIVITHVDDAEAMGGRGQVFHLHRHGCGLQFAVLVLVGSRGLGFQIHRHGVLVHQILVIHVLFLIRANGAVLPCGVDVHGGGLVVQNVAGGVGEVQAHPVAKLVQRVPVVKQPQFALGVPVGGGVLDVAAVVRNGLCPGHSLNEVQVPQNLTVPGQILAFRHIVDLCLSGNVLQVVGVQLPQPEAVDHHILQLFDLVPQCQAVFRVQRGHRLVKENDVRLHDQRPGNGRSLLLPTGELRGILVQRVPHADPLQNVLGHGGFLSAESSVKTQCVSNVFQHGHVLKQRVVLKHDADFPLVRRQVGDVLPAPAALSKKHGAHSAPFLQGCKATATRPAPAKISTAKAAMPANPILIPSALPSVPASVKRPPSAPPRHPAP